MENEKNYLEYLAELYPTIEKAATEIINLQSVINLPKGTEHFLSDIHGEYEAFSHVLRNGSGAVRKKIDDVFGHTLGISEKRALATLIYYPRERLEMEKKQQEDIDDWYKVMLYRLIDVCKIVSSKYTRAKVRKALPADYGYIIEELITEKPEVLDKEAYYKIMDCLMNYHSLDIQWGNHDVLWMGAATGQPACVASTIRICLHYGNLDVLEDGYGINMLPLATFALETYGDDPCECFAAKGGEDSGNSQQMLERRMHKAITVMQLKLENRLIRENPEYGMENRRLLEKIDYQNGTVTIGEKTYALRDKSFPTIDPAHPDELTEKEAEVLDKLIFAFRNSEKLQAHVDFLLKKGSLYRVYNGNLLYHGCMPMNEDGTLKEVQVDGKKYKGKALYDILEHNVRRAFVSRDPKKREQGRNTLWYLWTAPNSPLYGRDKMTTFERYFLAEKETWTEVKNAYYRLIEKEETADRILQEFGLAGENVHIINGHVPVRVGRGETPIKANGKLMVIDGGFAKAYHNTTGIAGYTLVFHSRGFQLVQHEPFTSAEEAIKNGTDIVSTTQIVEMSTQRMMVRDTDKGAELESQIEELKELLYAYRHGFIKESTKNKFRY